jgi:hypothetical protein
MTEAEWLASTDPLSLLEALRGKAGERKLRLFACACWRQRGKELAALGRGTRLLDAAADLERVADGLEPLRPMDEWATTLLAHDAWAAARQTAVAMLPRGEGPVSAAPMAHLLHDLFGDPFRPTTAPERPVLAWRGGAVGRLAEAVYQERRFEALPVLADMLEEAGCSDADVLGHLRGPGPHVRGCFVVDAILGRS